MDYRLKKIIKEAPIWYLSSAVTGSIRAIIKSTRSDEQKLADVMEVIDLFEERYYGEDEDENTTRD